MDNNINSKGSKDAAEFQRKLRELIEEYDVTIEVDTGYYGDVEGIDICCGEKRVASFNYGVWFLA